jgi:hypothetical protein
MTMSRPGSSEQLADAGKTAAAQPSAAQHSKRRPKATKGPRQPAAADAEPRKRPRKSSAAQQQPALDLDLDGLGLEQLEDDESEYDPDYSSEDDADAVLADLDDFDDIYDDSNQDEAPQKRSRRGATGSAR